jgi:type II secretion system protein C
MNEKIDSIKSYVQWGVIVLLFALTGYGAARLFVLFTESRMIVPPRMAIIRKIQQQQEKIRTVDESLAAVKALFPAPVDNKAGGAAATGPEAVSDIMSSLASMKLVATIIGEGSSLAVINVAKKDEVVTQGQTVGGFTVKQIIRNKVVLTNGAKDGILRMKFGEADEVQQTAAAQPSPAPSKDETPGVIKKEMSRREFETMIDPPDRVMREVGFATVSRDGKPYGIQITFVKPGSLLQTLGFLPGDILISANNKTLNSPEEGFTAYQMMKNEDTVDFKVDRQGRFNQLQIVFK